MKRRRGEFQKDLEAGHRAQAKASQAALRQMQQAEVPAGVLVNSESWGYFQSILQADIEGLGKLLESLQDSSLGNSSYDHGTLAEDKAIAQQIKGLTAPSFIPEPGPGLEREYFDGRQTRTKRPGSSEVVGFTYRSARQQMTAAG